MIQVENVSMRFRMANDKIVSLKEYAIAILKRRLKYRDFWVFQDISFQVGKGEVVGIIGKNGAGKSTLLKIIAGVLTPTKGKVTLSGNVVPMLELGSGFDMELSGRENIFLNGSILGYSKEFLEEKYKDILEFSELQEFIEMPIRNYSSGMLMRLAFSIATIVKPEILIVDEILAVGDEAFQRKSKRKMLELMSGGTTVLFVSHSIEQIREMCHRVIWLENGKIHMIGEAKKVCDAYQEFMNPVVSPEYSMQERKRNTDAEKYYMDILFIYGDLEEDYEWRVHNQKEQLLAGNMPSAEIYYQDISENLIAKYRVFFFVGCPAVEEIFSFIRKLKRFYKIVLIDCRERKEWEENQIYSKLKAEIDGIVAATKQIADMAQKEGYLVYLNPDVCSDRVEQLSEWAVYDRDQLPLMDVNQMSGDMEVVNYYRAVKKKEERENEKLRIGCFEKDAEVVKELLEVIFSCESEVTVYLNPDMDRIGSGKIDWKISDSITRDKKEIRYAENMEREKLPGIYADFDFILSVRNKDKKERQVLQERIYAGLVKTPFFIWNRTGEGKEILNFEIEYDFEIEAETAEGFYQKVKEQYQNKKKRKEMVERAFSQIKKEATAICTGWKFTKWIRKMEMPQAVFLLKNEMEEEEKNSLCICARECLTNGIDVLLLWDEKDSSSRKEITLCNQVPLLELSRSEVYLYGSFDSVIAGTWEECEFLQSYPNIRKRIFIQQQEKIKVYSSGDYRRFRMMQRYAPCVKMEFYMQKEFLEYYSEIFGEYVEAKRISSNVTEWYKEIFGKDS